MPLLIDLEGIPETVGNAIAETVRNLKIEFSKPEAFQQDAAPKSVSIDADAELEALLDSLPPMPSLSDQALSRENIYGSDGDRN